MKIGIVTTTFPRFKGDHIGDYVFQLANALRADNHHIKIIAPHTQYRVPPEIERDVIRVKSNNKSAKYITYGYGIIENLKRKPLLFFALPNLIRAYQKQIQNQLNNYDLIIVYFTLAGIALSRAKNITALRVYYGEGSDIHLMEKSFLYRTYFKRILIKYNKIVVVSSYLAKKLIKYQSPQKPLIIPNGISKNIVRYSANQKWDNPTVIYASRMIQLKQPFLLLRSWKYVVQEIPNAKLIMFGDGPLLPKMKKWIKAESLTNYITLKGIQPNKKVWRNMAKSWLTVLPSKEEGFQIGLLESLGVGTPFISTKTGGAAEMTTNTQGGVLIDINTTPEDLGQKIVSLLKDKNQLISMGNTARDKVRNLYSWETIARKFVSLHQNN